MIAVRLVHGIRAHWAVRASEWALAAGMAGWGYQLQLPEPTFSLSPSYAFMAGMASEHTWGWAAMTVGIVRLLALAINGTFAHKSYGRFSPHVRGTMAVFSVFGWCSIWFGLWASGTGAPGVPVYFSIMCLDIHNAARAFGDAGETDRAVNDAAT